jgi:hypothetical protein
MEALATWLALVLVISLICNAITACIAWTSAENLRRWLMLPATEDLELAHYAHRAAQRLQELADTKRSAAA